MTFVTVLIGYTLWDRSVHKMRKVWSAGNSYLEPFTGTSAGWFFLAERLYSVLGLGAAAIFAGIVLTRTQSAEASVAPPAADG